jgi:catechol 2,3-dioxygenase-like lactoylglutathione lyase family enzyme
MERGGCPENCRGRSASYGAIAVSDSGLTAVLAPFADKSRVGEAIVTITVEAAEAQRAALTEKYIKQGAQKYQGFSSEADGVNHLAFITDKLEETIEYYTQVIRLKLFRVRAGTSDSRVTQVFFEMGHGELLAFLQIPNITTAARPGLGGFHHYALTLNAEQYVSVMKRLDDRQLPYTTIAHEILTTITTTDPNGIVLELSMWSAESK